MSRDVQHEQYLSHYPGQLETVSWILWDTERYRGGGFVTSPPQSYTLSFFQSTKRRPRESNMWVPGCLPAPNGFITEAIRIRGITRKLAANGVLEFIIGNKRFLEMPLDNFTRHYHNVILGKPLFIAPLVCFAVRIYWDQARTFNTTRQPKIEVQLVGSMVRPVQ